MIQLGQFAINNLAPVLLGGFTILIWTAAKDDWHWLFRIPPIFTAVAAILLAFIPKESPEEAGYPGVVHDEATEGDSGTRATIKESFVTIFKHPLVWFYALAYGCTGAVRNSSDQLSVLYFVNQLHLDMSKKPAAVFWTMNLMPLAAVLGSFTAGWVSDKFFKGHRSPVAMSLYFFESLVIMIAAMVIYSGWSARRRAAFFSGVSFLF